jgi:hypothetical protein
MQTLANRVECPIIVPSQVTVSDDGEPSAKWCRAWDENASLSLKLARGNGPDSKEKQTAEQRRGDPQLWIACDKTRDIEPFAPVETRLLGYCHRILEVEDYNRLMEQANGVRPREDNRY